jgi:hypothetical protein
MTDVNSIGREDATRNALIDASVEGWRFARLFGRVLSKLDAGEAPRYANQARYFLKKIEDGLQTLGVSMVSLEGQPYDMGMAVSAINLADFAPDDTLFIEQMLEPVVMGPEGVLRTGKVIVAKADRL